MGSLKEIVVRQVRSSIGRKPATKKTLEALGLGRIGKQRTIKLDSAIAGMLKSVSHLIKLVES